MVLSRTYRVDLCESCVYADAYGFPNDMDGSDTEPKPLSRLGDGYLLGTLPCEHGRDCGSCDSPSSSAYFGRWCDGCGSMMGGNRYDYTLVFRGTER